MDILRENYRLIPLGSQEGDRALPELGSPGRLEVAEIWRK